MTNPNDTRWHIPGSPLYPDGNKENTFRIKFPICRKTGIESGFKLSEK